MGNIWTYRSIANHLLLDAALDKKCLGSEGRFFFLEKNPRVFYIPDLCPYCASKCKMLAQSDKWERKPLDGYNNVTQLYVCQTCGWWTIPSLNFHEELDVESMHVYAGQVRGELIQFDSTAEDMALDELRRYIIAHYDKRGEISPFKVEDAVAQAFRSSGYKVIATPRTRDNGIDLFVARKDDEVLKAVQVKRTGRKIGVELIRSFAGALLCCGVPDGIFVTTSEYTIDAKKAVDALSTFHGYRIELIDARALYEMLCIDIRPAYTSENDSSNSFYNIWKNPRSIAQTHLGSMDRIEI